MMAVAAVILYVKAREVPELNMLLFLAVLFSVIAVASLLFATGAIDLKKESAEKE
jgi:hypothetical protein